MGKPIIGITTGRDIGSLTTIRVPDTYVRAVLRAGGIPLLIPVGTPDSLLNSLRKQLDGILLTGGADVEPARFGGLLHERVYGVDPERDNLEINLVQLATRTGWPILGICRGIQVINVALGGTLFTHIPDQLPSSLDHEHHPENPYDYLAHPVVIQGGSLLGRIMSVTEVATNSLHHQGIEKLAPGLLPVAWTPDGLVEGVEVSGHPFGLGVQWHPEWMQDYALMQAIFRAFIQAAGSKK